VNLPNTDLWTPQVAAEWVAGIAADAGETGLVVEPGPDVPDMPDRVVVVTATSGAGEAMDGLMERPGFQLRVRGLQNDDNDAASLALRLDKHLRFATPATVAGVRVKAVQRLGDRPTLLGGVGDDAGRSTYTSTYIVKIM